MDQKRAKRVNRDIRDEVVERVHAAMLVTQGISGAPTREKIAQDLDFVLDEAIDHPEYQDQDYFWMGGFVVYVKRNANKYWHTYQVLVPGTNHMCDYKAEEPKGDDD